MMKINNQMILSVNLLINLNMKPTTMNSELSFERGRIFNFLLLKGQCWQEFQARLFFCRRDLVLKVGAD